MTRSAVTPVAVALAAMALAGACSDGGDSGGPPAGSDAAGTRRPPEAEATNSERVRGLEKARCPAGASNCRSASGRIIYVERVDPDGDGDAHFVLLSRESITGPGISVIDVAKDLRPSPLPGPGERISAAGPVYRGSHGQRQIQASTLNVAGRG